MSACCGINLSAMMFVCHGKSLCAIGVNVCLCYLASGHQMVSLYIAAPVCFMASLCQYQYIITTNTCIMVTIARHCSKGAIIISILHLKNLRHREINPTIVCGRFETRQSVFCAYITMNLLGTLWVSVASNIRKTLWLLMDIVKAGNLGGKRKEVPQSLSRI